ncbi:MAG: MFS transporter [Nostochopsis sp.]
MLIFCIYEPNRSRANTVAIQDSETQSNISVPVNLLILIFGVTILSQVIFYLIPVQLPFYLRSLTNATPAQSGVAIATATLFSAFGSLAYGRVRAKLDFVSILPIIFGLMGIGYTIIGLVGSYVLILLGLAIAGLGLGLMMPNMTVWVSNAVSDAVRGRALGGLSTSLFLGQFLSPIISQPVSAKVGLGLTYTWAGGLLLILAILFVVMKQQVVALTREKGVRV